MTEEMLTVDDVARITNLSVHTIRAAVRDGELHASKLRGRIRITPDDLADWIADNSIEPAIELPRDRPAAPAPRLRSTPPAGGYRQAVRERRNAA